MQLATLRGVAVTALLLLTTASLSAQDGWQALDTGTTQDLYAIHFVSADVGYVAGAAGTVLRTTDGGATWADVSPGGQDLYGVHFFTASEGVVVGAGGTVMRTTDGGANWTAVTSGTSSTLYSVSFADNVGLAGGASQAILRSLDRGVTWEVVQDDFFGGGFFGVDMLTDADGFVAGQNSIFQPLFAVTADGGEEFDFTAFYLNNNEGKLEDVSFVDALNGVSVGRTWDFQGAIARTTDGGATWTSTLFPSVTVLYGVDLGAGGTGVAVGDEGVILMTTDGGQTWATAQSGTAAALNDVTVASSTVAYAAGAAGTVLKGTFASSLPVSLTVTPLDPPVTVAPGGSFSFTVQVANTGDEAVTFDLWAEGRRDGGGPSVTRGPRTFTLPAGVSRQVTVTQRVPAGAPEGAYTFTVALGDYPGDAFASESFPVTVTAAVVAEANGAGHPERYALEQNAPNPFRGQASIRYSLPEAAHVTLRVYDALGKEVAVLVEAEQAAGRHEVAFDAAELPAGVYFYRLEAGAFEASRTMHLVK